MKRTLFFALFIFWTVSTQAKQYSNYFSVNSKNYYYGLLNAIDATEKAAEQKCQGWDYYSFKNKNWERTDCYTDIETSDEWTVTPVQNYTKKGLPYTTYVPKRITYTIYACSTTAYCWSE